MSPTEQSHREEISAPGFPTKNGHRDSDSISDNIECYDAVTPEQQAADFIEHLQMWLRSQFGDSVVGYLGNGMVNALTDASMMTVLSCS